MAVLTAITSWTVADVQHFARRAGFGLTPTESTALQAQAPSAVIDAWIDGTGPAHDLTAFNAALATADVVPEPLISANTSVAGSVEVPAVPAPHAFLVEGANAWRNSLNTAQALCAWRMQHSPYAFQERMALFWHNLFATGWHKVNNAALMLKQYQLFRSQGLARALSGWSFTYAEADLAVNPANPNQRVPANARFRVYDGSAISPDTRLWNGQVRATSYTLHGTGTITLFGQTFDITTTANGWAKGEDALRAVMKTLLKSQYFFDPTQRHALAEGPVSWIVRAARMLCPSLATASGQTPKGYPAWRLVANNATTFDQAGMKLLDSSGPNGWNEHAAWLNSNTMRYRTKVAAALALGETRSYDGTVYPLFPAFVTADWFPAAPASAQAVYDRLVALLQPGPIPSSVSAAWLSALWPTTFTWDAPSQTKARELAFLLLCSPAGQLY